MQKSRIFVQMHLVELKTFLAIVETGSLVRASQRLNVTQSTVTARLKALELEIGQTLINRNKSGATLTAAGVRLQRYAETISDLWFQAQQEVSLPDAVSTVCNLGCHPDLWHGLGDRLFDFIRNNVSEAAISIWHGNEAVLSGWLDDGLVDIAITYSPNANQKQDMQKLYQDDLVLVSTDADSPLRFDPGYVFVEAGEEFGRDHAIAYADANTARLSFGNAQLGLDFILKNGGTAYLPHRMVQEQIGTGNLHIIGKAKRFSRTAYIVWNSSAHSSWPWFESAVSEAAQTGSFSNPAS